MRLLVWLIGLGIRVGGYPIRLVRGPASAIGRHLTWLRPVAQIGLRFLVLVRSNTIVSAAITLSVINLGLIMWQIWPEDTGQTILTVSQPIQNSEAPRFDNTSRRIAVLEAQIRELTTEQQFQFARLIDCINYPSPFGCQRHTP